MNITNIISILIVMTSFAIGTYFYNSMPNYMASHWNSIGQADGYILKFWGLYLMPIISLFIYVVFLLIPKIHPLKANIEKFRYCFNSFSLLLLIFFLYLYLVTIYWNLGNTFNIKLIILPALSTFFFYIGILLNKAKKNWFIGIRTPWTLASDRVWNNTHKLGGILFKILSIITFFSIFAGNHAYYFVVIPFIVFIISLFIYSYVEYADEGL